MRTFLALATALLSAGAAASTYDLPATPQTVAWGHYDATAKPVLTIKSGDTVVVHTLLTNSPTGLERAGVAPTDALSIYDQVVPNRGAILIPTREGEHGRFNFKCDQGATYGLTQLLYSDAVVGFLSEFAKTTDHRPEILLSFGFVPKVETRVGLINWLIQDPGNAAVADEQAFVSQLAETDPAQKRKLMIDLYKRVVDGVADLGFPLSIHLEAAYGTSAPAFETFAEMLDYWSPDKG